MGSSITIDKHTTNIQEWFQVANKLDSIDFDSQITSHVGLWKIFQQSKNKDEFNVSPVLIDYDSLNQIFKKNQCYVIYAIKKSQHQNPQAEPHIYSTQLNLCLENMKNNIQRQSFQTPLKKNSIDRNQYRIYSLFGNKSKPQARLLAASYCLKLNDVLSSKKKLTIISGGGVLRNKKLQKGSVLPFQLDQESQNKNFNIINLNKDNSKIDILNFFSFAQNQYSTKSDKAGLSIINFKSQTVLPQIKDIKVNLKESSSIHSSYENTTSQMNEEVAVQDIKPQKIKNVPQKMSLKLDFSKPLNLGVLNLAPKRQKSDGQQNQNMSSNSIQSIGLTNGSEQRRGKRQKCEEQCSQIIDGLYVSGQKVAKNFETLQKNNIKYIINCAGDYCENWFEDKGFEYLTFFLKDSQTQNIQCLFYRVIQFIQAAHKNKQNVLIHCIQGISRSVTFIIAYIIFKYGYDYKKAQSFVKQKRSIACPNNGFMVELIQFHKRLYDDYESLIKPRIFLISSHSKQTPHILTARMLKTQLFDNKKYIGLDSRGVYIIHVPQIMYIWVGSKCDELRLQNYWAFANQFVKKLQKYERAPVKVKAISQGSQQKQFLMIWNLTEAPKLYQNPEYNRLFIDSEAARPGLQRQFYEQIQQQQEIQNKKLFIFPDFKIGLGVFSYEDLNGMCILSRILVENNDKKLLLHIWKDDSSDSQGSDNDQAFLQKVIETHFSNFDEQNIEIMEQDFQKPSNVFKKCFIG